MSAWKQGLAAQPVARQPDDAYEQEADRVAEHVMRMPDHAAPAIDAATENAIGSLSSRGSALPESVRAFMEPRFTYVASELDELANRGNTDAGLEHLGNAFHTIEDCCAHSNFVELLQGDVRHGATLITGNPVGSSDAVPGIMEAISPRGVREHYREQAENAIATALPGSHTRVRRRAQKSPTFGGTRI